MNELDLARTFYETSKEIIERGDYLTDPLALDREEVERAHKRAAEALGLPVAVNLRERVKQLEAENARLREALTPSGDTKAAYMGEFKISRALDYDNDGNPTIYGHTYVPWTTIKEIMAAIRVRAKLAGKAGT